VRKIAEPSKIVATVERDAVVVAQSITDEDLLFDFTSMTRIHLPQRTPEAAALTGRAAAATSTRREAG
jgi:hypothetical protein